MIQNAFVGYEAFLSFTHACMTYLMKVMSLCGTLDALFHSMTVNLANEEHAVDFSIRRVSAKLRSERTRTWAQASYTEGIRH